MGDAKNYKGLRVYKIKYFINLLAQIDMHFDNDLPVNEQISLMKLCRDTDELAIFDAHALLQIIQFKWDSFGLKTHAFGCFMHLVGIILIVLYVNNSYLSESES